MGSYTINVSEHLFHNNVLRGLVNESVSSRKGLAVDTSSNQPRGSIINCEDEDDVLQGEGNDEERQHDKIQKLIFLDNKGDAEVILKVSATPSPEKDRKLLKDITLNADLDPIATK